MDCGCTPVDVLVSAVVGGLVALSLLFVALCLAIGHPRTWL